MALQSYICEYETDAGKMVKIKINYDDSSAAGRLTDGGLAGTTGACNFAIPRRYLKPRYVITNDKGLTYFKTQAGMKTFLTGSKEKVVRYCGECGGSCIVDIV
jgi:hypothetical protein